jgi:hypothetical protein
MKNYLMIAFVAMGAVVGFTGCKSSETSVEKGATEISNPFPGKEYRTDKDYFRAIESGESPDRSTAKKIALANARTELAENIQALVNSVQDQYINQISEANGQTSVDSKKDYESKFEELTRTVVSQSVNDVRIIGDRVFQEKNGRYIYHIAIEAPRESLVSKLSGRISEDDKLKLEFDKHRFQKIFDEEMEKFQKGI